MRLEYECRSGNVSEPKEVHNSNRYGCSCEENCEDDCNKNLGRYDLNKKKRYN